ncbi:HNH endonuclease [Desulfuromonas versatilis]|uniref:Putative HNH nuclease YajD n=1 Tax=Desulfuromonas versatilis TaxID=2802975 RepID=A0ABN6DXR5_9BACT|nr:YajD family HNH nuclease [Desulfuromonas versatilis]BCR04906.1 HNH endonuclease [Desulfuromonas versatilis]
MGRSFKPRGKRGPTPPAVKSQEEADTLVRKLRGEMADGENYREKSLKLHGWICAKCGREFEASTLHLLTVHHKDGNHHNNPPDGSNWENLCIYCHDDEHSRSLLGDYLSGAGKGRG